MNQLLTDEAYIRKLLVSWSREVQLFEVGRGLFRCQCGSDWHVTVGRDDRVRCGGCKTIHFIEI